jgi:hypothetical protein
MITALCVLRSGGEYKVEHVVRLHGQWAAHYDKPYRFVCLNDVHDAEITLDEVEYVPLKYDWPRWWAKVEMFSPDMERFGRMFFMDLDNTICGDMSDLAGYDGTACVTSDFNWLDCPSQSVLNFAPGTMHHLWDTFMQDPAEWMKQGDRRIPPHYGDQILMTKVYGKDIDRWQDLFPGQVVSYKKHCKTGVPENARIIQFHGKPKPWDVTL